MDDNTIIDLFWSRSETAIAETNKKYGAYCMTIAMNILQNREDSNECLNDTYHMTWSAIPPQRPVIFPAFLGRIARNVSLNKYKARHTKKRGGQEMDVLLSELEHCLPAPNNVEAEYETGQVAKTISNFLYAMNTHDRIIFVRRYWYADSIAALAQRYQMGESKVKSLLFRTRNKLRVYLEREEVNL
ncbi:MAG: sigma-70 family RNA polymerase sigma factor [Peptococcaceae bacterium]|jgi:RNA polymerase sigma-70 factor (ECF subfamily)|nr:sigma-70 family RNA polymerase sigma factor [Peptococcaceae bacterium]